MRPEGTPAILPGGRAATIRRAFDDTMADKDFLADAAKGQLPILPINGETRRLVIENNPGVLTPDEIAQRLAALEALKVHPRDQQINTLLLARLDRLYQECLGDARDYIAGLANRFQQVLDTQDEHRIREARGDITQRLAHFEQEG